jgi:uncharacterized protein YbgA (DUF1722 family)/uncharacterized protein YbbK (DUF523 family)
MSVSKRTVTGPVNAVAPSPVTNREFVRPVVVISQCLELEACRYNGQRIPYDFISELRPHVDLVPTCPEVEIGLGVPRDPLRLVTVGGETRMLQPASGRDVSDDMHRFSERFLTSLADVDGFILKSRSPSCGIKDVKVYSHDTRGAPAAKGSGLFATKVLKLFPELAVGDEGRLRIYRIREHFLTKLFCLAELRRVAESGSMKDLACFHTRHKFLLMAYNQKAMRILGRIVANQERRPFGEVVAFYRRHLGLAFKRALRYTSMINVLQHAAGFFSKQLNREEKRFFQASLENYRRSRTPVSSASAIVRSWAIRFESEYLVGQSFFEPYPEALMRVRDSGKGRSS